MKTTLSIWAVLGTLLIGLISSAAVPVNRQSVVLIPSASVSFTENAPDVRLEEDGVGVAIEDEKLLVAVRVANRGHDAAFDVQLTRISLHDAALLKPALPLRVGTITGGKHAVVQLAFTRDRVVEGGEYRLTIHGRSRAGNFQLRRAITVPVPDGQAVAGRATAPVQRISGAFLPPARTPLRLEHVNKDEREDGHPPLADGKFIGALGPHGRPSKVLKWNWGGFGIPEPNTGIAFIRAGVAELNLVTDRHFGLPWDPSGASVDLVTSPAGGLTPLVFLTGNRYALMSVDGGATFNHLDPTTMFNKIPLDGLPQDVGLCCDMNLVYIPSIDRVVWQMLTGGSAISSADPESPHHWNRLRVAFASPHQIIDSNGTSWSYWDMTTATFGLNNQEAFLDYPDIHYTSKGLYFTVADEGRLLVIRVPLGDLQGGGTIHIGFTNPDDSKAANGARLVHYSPDAGYWARHGTTSELIVYEWPDGSGTYSWHTIPIDSWRDSDTPDDFTSLTPDGTNWLRADAVEVRGGTFQGDFKNASGGVTRRIVFAWNAPRTSAVPQPHVRIQPILRTSAFGKTLWSAEPSTDMWHPDFAFHHAHLASNINGEVGVSVGAGGGGTGSADGSEATAVAGFLGDNTLYAIGVSTTSIDIYGDYTAIRRHWPDERYFSVSDYYLLGSKPNFTVWAQYRMFARPADLP